MITAFTILQLGNIILVFIFLFLAFRYLESTWSYRISKPFQWEAAVKKGEISKKLKRIERLYRDKVRFYAFWLQIERLKRENIQGAFAEVGVYKGETARIIHLMDPSRSLHLFDTFEGFAKQDLVLEETKEERESIDFSDTSVERVTQFIDGNQNVIIHKGYFPESTEGLPPDRYAFVHLDADLYQPTLSALRYFYPKLSAGGVLIIHDYNHNWPGVKKAIAEFSVSFPENLVEIADWQGSVMIIRSKSRIHN